MVGRAQSKAMALKSSMRLGVDRRFQITLDAAMVFSLRGDDAGAAARTPPQRAIGPNYTVPDRAPRVAGLQRRAVRGVRPKRDENEPVGKPVWGANRPKSRAIRWT